MVIGLPKEDLEHLLREMKTRHGFKDDTQVSAEGWRELIAQYKSHFKKKTGKDFPGRSEGAILGRDRRGLRIVERGEGRHLPPRGEESPGSLGTAVNVVQMVFGNTGENSGTGVCFTRDPSYGREDFLRRFPDQRPGRRRRRRHPHADAPHRDGPADAEGLQAARKGSSVT